MTAVLVEFTVRGDPKPKGRPRFRAGQGGYTPKATRDAEAIVAASFRLAAPAWVPVPQPSRLRIDAAFYRATRRHVDTDNLLKLVTDALNGVAWEDDEQLAEVHATRVYGAGRDARTVVRIAQAVTP